MTGTPAEIIRKRLKKAPRPRRESKVDYYHGFPVKDPFRWLESSVNDDARKWSERQNELTESLIAELPARRRFEDILGRLMKRPRYQTGFKRSDRYFIWKNRGTDARAILYELDRKTDNMRPILDPSTLSSDGSAAVLFTEPSHDGAYIAYTVSERGSDWQELRIRKTDDCQDLPERLQRISFCSIAWKKDGSGFYYNRYPDKETLAPEDYSNFSRVCFHHLNTDQSADRLVYDDPEHKEFDFMPYLSHDGHYLLLSVHSGTNVENGILIRDETIGGDVHTIVAEGVAAMNFVGNDHSTLFFVTNLHSPNYRLVAIHTNDPTVDSWQTIISESDDVIVAAVMIRDGFAVLTMRHAAHRLSIYDRSGRKIHDVDLPPFITIEALEGDENDSEILFSASSFLFQRRLFSFQTDSEALTPLVGCQGEKFESYVTQQEFIQTEAGIRIPLYIVSKKDIERDGSHPTILYGYGGFGISLTPTYAYSTHAWLEMGGVYAVANIRGGGEYGEEWHKSGMLDKKQNVFDDFLACARWLVRERYTRPGKLAIRGGSNGGLLVAAATIQAPELFGSVVCEVPVIDMLRYQTMLIGRYWVGEYGNAEQYPDHFSFLHAYSPLHTISRGVEYPPMLVVSADHDDRVSPAHAKKFVAALQTESDPQAPALLKIDRNTGHGHGKTTQQMIEEESAVLAFLAFTLNMNVE